KCWWDPPTSNVPQEKDNRCYVEEDCWNMDTEIPHEFIGYWLIRPYPSSGGRVRRSILSGGDAVLVRAVAEAFCVPLEHIECRVVHTFQSKADADLDDYDYWNGTEHFRLAFVDGMRCSKGEEGEEIGMARGNDVEHPVFMYRDAYLRFHVKYLKDYFRRKAKPSDGSLKPNEAADVACAPTANAGDNESADSNETFDDEDASGLVHHLHNNAVFYANRFSNGDWEEADERFVKYAAKRAKQLDESNGEVQ
ncbi:Hypothetical protein, putative, partial [Bodo saltans]